MTAGPVPRRLGPEAPELGEVLALIRREFAYMDGRIDPPSSMLRLTPEALAALAREGEVWVIGTPPRACVVLSYQPDALYLGKLAVDADHRGEGLARRLVALARARAGELGLPRLRLQSRVELVEVHAAFARLGFRKTGETAHPGYDRPTSLTMELALGPQDGVAPPSASPEAREGAALPRAPSRDI